MSTTKRGCSASSLSSLVQSLTTWGGGGEQSMTRWRSGRGEAGRGFQPARTCPVCAQVQAAAGAPAAQAPPAAPAGRWPGPAGVSGGGAHSLSLLLRAAPLPLGCSCSAPPYPRAPGPASLTHRLGGASPVACSCTCAVSCTCLAIALICARERGSRRGGGPVGGSPAGGIPRSGGRTGMRARQLQRPPARPAQARRHLVLQVRYSVGVGACGSGGGPTAVSRRG